MNVETLRLLVAKGLSPADILEIAETLDQPKPRSANAERQARFRARHKADGVTSGVTDNVTSNVTEASPQVSPNDIYSNPLPSPPQPSSPPAPTLPERVVEAWNDGPGKRGATAAKPLNPDRRKALAARCREHSEAEVFEAISNLAASPWHTGQNDRGWKANIGWLLKSPENFQKALEMEPQRAGAQVLTLQQPKTMAQMILDRKAARG